VVPGNLAESRTESHDLGLDAILLCWESFNVRCHRRLVAEWLEDKLGIIVPELGHERAESVPFSEQPSKWDGKAHHGSIADAVLNGGRLKS
jgi:hypothetical protein